MINEYQIRVVPEVAAQEDRLKRWLADENGVDMRTICGVRILKRSIDARQRQIYVNLKVRVYVKSSPTVMMNMSGLNTPMWRGGHR